jgi:FtsH-binding integral membrane protein
MITSEDSIWDRREANPSEIISDRLYNIMIGLTLLWGFAVNYLMVQNIPLATVMSVPYWVLIVGYFISAFTGMMIYTRSDKPLFSFLGYNLVVIPIGILLVPILSQFDSNLIQRALAATGAVTTTMMMLGGAYPKFFLSMGRVLGLALILAILFEVGMMFFGGGSPNFMDWVIAIIFCGYIGFDWARANMIPKTLDNAIDSAAALYLDIINLFLRILSILSRR